MDIRDTIKRLIPLSLRADSVEERRADHYSAGGSNAAVFNTLNGVGTSVDKGESYRVGNPRLLTTSEITTLVRHSWVASVICGELPADALATGLGFRDGEIIEDDRFESWGVKIREASTRARTYGGALILLYVDDNRATEEEVGDSRGILNMVVADRRELTPIAWTGDLASPNYGLPELYQYQPVRGEPSVWHYSRVIRMIGEPLAQMEAEQEQGWGDSVLQRVWEQVGQHAMVNGAVSHVVSEFKTSLFKMQGLNAAVSNPNCANDLMARFQLTNTLKGMTNAVVISDGEEFENRVVPLTGLPEVMDRFSRLLAAASRMPQTKFFGDSPSGLSSNNESGERQWEQQVMTHKREVLIPAYRRLIELTPDLRDRDIEINPLPMRIPTPSEQADIDLKRAQRDSVLIAHQVLSPQAVADTYADEFEVQQMALDFGEDPVDAEIDQ